jgi:transposase InsO family protein
MRQSTGRTGSCFDNAAAESFFAALKSEIGVREWATRALARNQVFRWIAAYYNRKRLHSSIDYLTPVQAPVRYGQPVALAA